MLRLFKKKNFRILETHVLDGMTDVHSHLVYGVDDGSKSADVSCEIFRVLSEIGMKRSFCTPHIKAELTRNTPTFLREKYAQFKASTTAYSDIETRLAAEYMIDGSLGEKIEAGDLLSYDGRHVLVEMSHMAAPSNKSELIFTLLSNSYIPVLAHPERYNGFEDVASLRQMKANGCKMQLNLLSLAGVYGIGSLKLSQELLEGGIYDYIGTDIHNPSMVKYVEAMKISDKHIEIIRTLVENNDTLWVE